MTQSTPTEFETYLENRIILLEKELREHETNGTITEQIKNEYTQRIMFCDDALFGIYLDGVKTVIE